jgi:hypothetical protein
MKSVLIAGLMFFLFSNNIFGQDMGSIYENFKVDSARFRSLQKKKKLSNELLVYQLGYNNRPLSKKLTLYSQLNNDASYVWIMKDTNNKIQLIVCVDQVRLEENSNFISILNFNKNQDLIYYRKEINNHSMIAVTKNTQNWITDNDSQPRDYFFIEGNVMVDKPYCDPKEILNEYHGGTIAVNSQYVKPTLPEILKAFGIYKF